MNRNLVFPLWYRHWASRGIEGTREANEDIYKTLLENQDADLDKQKWSFNIALFAVHQSGDMIGHLVSYLERTEMSYVHPEQIKGMMDSLSSDEFLPEWNEELEEAGVVLPVTLQTDLQPKIAQRYDMDSSSIWMRNQKEYHRHMMVHYRKKILDARNKLRFYERRDDEKKVIYYTRKIDRMLVKINYHKKRELYYDRKEEQNAMKFRQKFRNIL